MANEAGKANVGLVGLAVMGQNLVLNMADHGFRVAVYAGHARAALEQGQRMAAASERTVEDMPCVA